MDSDMKELSSTMESIHSQFDATEASVEASRDSVAQLVGTKRLLSRLNFLFELPTTLKKCIVERRFDDAVSSYKTSTKVGWVIAFIFRLASRVSIRYWPSTVTCAPSKPFETKLNKSFESLKAYSEQRSRLKYRDFYGTNVTMS